jgi:Zn-dependent protease
MIRIGTRELLDLVVAWLALGLAFTFFFEGQGVVREPVAALRPFGLVLITVGTGFLLHELAHKVVAINFGQIAEFRADYGMLFLAVMGGLVGFIFAAPGAVHHRGRITPREHGLIAVAGPVTNLALAAVFAGLWPFLPAVGTLGVSINLLLAGFNMLPIGPLDGRTVLDWHLGAYVLVAGPSLALALWALTVGPGL